MGQRSIRFPDELEVRLAAAAKRDGRSFSNFVVRMLESAMGPQTKAPELREPYGGNASPSPTRAPAKKVEIALEARDAVRARNASLAVPGVKTARDLMEDRQARLNAAKKK